jgi:hypothetical protein
MVEKKASTKGSKKVKPLKAKVVESEEVPKKSKVSGAYCLEVYSTNTGETLIFVDPSIGTDEVGKYIEGIIVFTLIKLPEHKVVIDLFSDSAIYVGPTRIYVSQLVARFMTLDEEMVTDKFLPEIPKILDSRRQRTSKLISLNNGGSLIIH